MLGSRRRPEVLATRWPPSLLVRSARLVLLIGAVLAASGVLASCSGATSSQGKTFYMDGTKKTSAIALSSATSIPGQPPSCSTSIADAFGIVETIVASGQPDKAAVVSIEHRLISPALGKSSPSAVADAVVTDLGGISDQCSYVTEGALISELGTVAAQTVGLSVGSGRNAVHAYVVRALQQAERPAPHGTTIRVDSTKVMSQTSTRAVVDVSYTISGGGTSSNTIAMTVRVQRTRGRWYAWSVFLAHSAGGPA